MPDAPAACSSGPPGRLLEHLDRALGAESSFTPAPYKLQPPRLRANGVSRAALVERLRAASADVVLVIAPAGYGKTTLVREWVASGERPWAWLSLDVTDNDPVVLLTDLALALDRVERVDPAMVTALWTSAPSVATSVVPRFARFLSERRTPLLVVLDDVDRIADRESLDLLSALLTRLPSGSRVALVGRRHPDLRLGRLRAERDVLELGASDLALDVGEAWALFDRAHVQLERPDVSRLVEQTEGWAVALGLAAVALRGRGEARPEGLDIEFGGDQRVIADYLRDELLSELDEDSATFLLHASCLRRLSGPVCDAAFGRQGSSELLERLQEQNLLVVPLDDRGGWYRLRPLLTDLLQRELERREPGVAVGIHRRASAWFEQQRDIDAAVDHAWRAGDTARVQQLVATHLGSYVSNGRHATVERWLQPYAQEDLLADPMLAVFAAQARFTAGDGDAALHWLDRAEQLLPERFPGPGSGREAWPAWGPAVGVALLRAAIAPLSATDMAISAEFALRRVPRGAYWAHASLLVGMAAFLVGEEEAARRAFANGAVEAEDAPTARALALSYLAHLHVEHGEWEPATRLGRQARALLTSHDLDSRPTMTMVTAMSSLVEARAGRRTEAQADRLLTRRHLVGFANVAPWANLETRVSLVRAAMLLGDRVGAATYLDEAEHFLHVMPDAIRAKVQVADLRRAIAEPSAGRAHGPGSLTLAELRVLSYLPTHLSLAEIADRLFVSRNTVKSQSISIYRKLGATSRGSAVDVAREAALFDEGV